jgi:hypothetical protein
MELEELKNSWNALDKRLADNEVVNLRIVKEIIAQKTKTAFDGIVGHNIYGFVVTIIIMCVVFPCVWMNTPITLTSFLLVECAMAIGLIPQIWKLLLLSKFDLGGKSASELSGLVLRYKKVCHDETLWAIVTVATAFIAFYISELGFNTAAGYTFGTNRILFVAGLTLLTFVLAFFIGLWQRRRHTQQMLEIEQGLEELREFEK